MGVLPCVAWGFGTAVGELPPYFISREAARAKRKDGEYQKEIEESRGKTDPFSRMKMWTIDMTQKYGFVGVFLLASWPNAAFDMCGMACGYLMMPFWTFFLATALGKGVVKVNFQAGFFIALFSKQFFQKVLVPVAGLASSVLALFGDKFAHVDVATVMSTQRDKVIRKFQKQGRFSVEQATGGRNYLTEADVGGLYAGFEDPQGCVSRVMKTWDANQDGVLSQEEIQGAVSGTDGKFSLGTLDPDAGGDSWMKMGWDLFLAGVIAFFLISVIDQMASQKLAELAEAKEKKGKKKMK